jgi:hypothetical protein
MAIALPASCWWTARCRWPPQSAARPPGCSASGRARLPSRPPRWRPTREIAQLIARIDGLRPVDAGRLEQSRIVESLTALLIGTNARYKSHAGIRITGLPADLWP